jgi:hypothetical protein
MMAMGFSMLSARMPAFFSTPRYDIEICLLPVRLFR